MIQVVKILMTKHCKGKISGLRDQVGSPDFKPGLKLLGVLFMNSFLGVANVCNCSDNKEQWAQINLPHYLIVAENTEADSLIGPEAPKTHASQDDRPLK